MNTSQRGALAHARFAKKVDGVEVIYRRDVMDRPLTAWIGTVSSTRSSESAIVPVTSDRDYLFQTTDLSEFGIPQRGDRIIETINGESCSYEVLPPDNGDPCWTYQGHSQAMIRVYTKRME